MIKLLLQHLAALAAAIVPGAAISLAVTEMLLPPATPSILPRAAGVMLYAARLAGGVYILASAILIFIRWRTKTPDPFAVAARTLLLTWGFMIVVSIGVCLCNNSTHWLR